MSPATYHGVVRGGIVLLDNGSQLADGTEVNVSPVAHGYAVIIEATQLPPPKVTLGELLAFLRDQPSLGDDAESFAEDLRAIREETRLGIIHVITHSGKDVVQ